MCVCLSAKEKLLKAGALDKVQLHGLESFCYQ